MATTRRQATDDDTTAKSPPSSAESTSKEAPQGVESRVGGAPLGNKLVDCRCRSALIAVRGTSNPVPKAARRVLCQSGTKTRCGDSDVLHREGPAEDTSIALPALMVRDGGDLAKASCGPGKAATEALAALLHPAEKKREILCIDDDAIQLKLLRRIVEQAGFACTTLSTAEAALELLHSRAAESGTSSFPESLIMDINLGTDCMDGIQAMQAVRERYPDAILPVTLCSSDQDQISYGVELQTSCDTATSCIFKPFNKAAVLACIKSQAKVAELQRCRRLLSSILPPSVVSRFEPSRPKIISDYHEETTVLFSDVVSFTTKVATFSTIETMGVLHEMFSYFDCLTDIYGVSKVETIGGHPTPPPPSGPRSARNLTSRPRSLVPIRRRCIHGCSRASSRKPWRSCSTDRADGNPHAQGCRCRRVARRQSGHYPRWDPLWVGAFWCCGLQEPSLLFVWRYRQYSQPDGEHLLPDVHPA